MRCAAVILTYVAGCGRIGFDAREALECPDSYAELSTGCYRFAAQVNERDWLGAELACEAEGGHLAVVDDEEDRAAIFGAVPSSVTDFWIGATARVTPGAFVAVTRRPFFIVWNDTEPNMTGACLEFELAGMGDSNCANVNDYLCEIDGIAVDPTTY